MKFIKKIEFSKFEEIKQALETSLVVHAIPKTKIEIAENFYSDCVHSLGVPFYCEEDFTTNNKTGNLWSDIIYSPSKSNSFSHSNTRQPFHTDGAYEKNSPDISFFYCVEKAKFGGCTNFIDNILIAECLKFYNKELLLKIKKYTVNFLKGNDGKECLILDENNNLNWNYFRAEKNNMVEEFHSFLEEVIWKGGIYDSISLSKNESLFFWDRKVLHGRNSFLGNRHLKKAGFYV
jgi:alpha-ketoglutarate-dependent taurine dioxygenase